MQCWFKHILLIIKYCYNIHNITFKLTLGLERKLALYSSSPSVINPVKNLGRSESITNLSLHLTQSNFLAGHLKVVLLLQFFIRNIHRFVHSLFRCLRKAVSLWLWPFRFLDNFIYIFKSSICEIGHFLMLRNTVKLHYLGHSKLRPLNFKDQLLSVQNIFVLVMICPKISYIKVSDNMAFANSVAPDQAAPSGTVRSRSTLFAFPLSILKTTA